MVPIEDETDENKERDKEDRRRTFPDSAKSKDSITAFQLTSNFLIYSTNVGFNSTVYTFNFGIFPQIGCLNFFLLEDWAFVSEFRHDCSIIGMFPNASGSKVMFLDENRNGFVYSPVGWVLLLLIDDRRFS